MADVRKPRAAKRPPSGTQTASADLTPDDNPGVPKLDFAAFGQTGLRHAGGYISEETIPALRGDAARRTYKAMADNDYTVGAVVFAMTALFRGVGHSIQSADESEAAEEGKAFVEEVFDDMDTSFAEMMSEAASMFVFGFAGLEILYKRRVGPRETDLTARSKFKDGKIGIRGLPLRAQTSITRWVINDATGAILGMVQQPNSGHETTIPIEKMLLFRTTAERNNPEGRSILRSAWRAWMFKRRMEEIEGVGVERDLAGFPVGRIPSQYMDPDAEPAEKAVFAAWQQMITRIKRDQQEGIIIPSDVRADGSKLFDLTLLSSGSTRSIDTSKIIDRLDRAIATSVLADFIFLGQQAVGSFALSSDKTALFAQSLKAFLDVVVGEINRKLLPALWDLNDLPEETMPTVKFADVETLDLTQITALITTMTGAGAQMFPDRELENHLRKLGGLPEAPEEGAEGSPEGDLMGGAGAVPPGMGAPAGGPESGQQGGEEGDVDPYDVSRYFLGR
jgi:hypothetical protein